MEITITDKKVGSVIEFSLETFLWWKKKAQNRIGGNSPNNSYITLNTFELITRGESGWASCESIEVDNYSLENIKDQ